MDIALALAFEILEQERCPQCGMYVWMCHTEDTDIQFDVVEDICEARRAVGERDEQIKDKKSWISLRPVPVMENKERDFPSLRKPYFEQERARFEADQEEV